MQDRKHSAQLIRLTYTSRILEDRDSPDYEHLPGVRSKRWCILWALFVNGLSLIPHRGKSRVHPFGVKVQTWVRRAIEHRGSCWHMTSNSAIDPQNPQSHSKMGRQRLVYAIRSSASFAKTSSRPRGCFWINPAMPSCSTSRTSFARALSCARALKRWLVRPMRWKRTAGNFSA